MTTTMGRFHSPATVETDTLAHAGDTVRLRCIDRFLAFRRGQRACVWRGHDSWAVGTVMGYDVRSGEMQLSLLEVSDDGRPSLPLLTRDSLAVDLAAPRGPPGPPGPPGIATHAPFLCIAYTGTVQLEANRPTDVRFSRVLCEDVPGTFAVGRGAIEAQAASFLGMRVSVKCRVMSNGADGVVVVTLDLEGKGSPDGRWSFGTMGLCADGPLSHTFPLVRSASPGDRLHLRAYHMPRGDTSPPVVTLCDFFTYVEA